MKHRKLPAEAFSYYMSLGVDRSYALVAKKYGVTRRTVTRNAVREGWKASADEWTKKTRLTIETRSRESIASMTARHIDMAREIQAKALAELRRMPMKDASDAARLLEQAMRYELSLRLFEESKLKPQQDANQSISDGGLISMLRALVPEEVEDQEADQVPSASELEGRAPSSADRAAGS